MDETPFGDDTLHEECGVFGISSALTPRLW